MTSTTLKTYSVAIIERSRAGARRTVTVAGTGEGPALYSAAVTAAYGAGHHYRHDSGLLPHYGYVAWPSEDGATTTLGAPIRVDVDGEVVPSTILEAWGDAATLATGYDIDYVDSQGETRHAAYSGQDVYTRARRGLRTIRERGAQSITVTGSWRDGEITRRVDLRVEG